MSAATTGSGTPMTEDEIRSAVASANVPALLMTIYQFSGDERWLTERYRPLRGKGLGGNDSGGLPEDVQTEIREAAVPVILALQAGAPMAIPEIEPTEMAGLLSIYLGEHVDERYGPMIGAEIERREHPERPDATPIDAPADYSVLVVGLGVAGLVAAHYLEQMGLDYTILEKQANPGGSWWQNSYPGAGVDTPSHLYAFSFVEQDWTKHFALRDELAAYFDRSLDVIGARDRVRFGTEVLEADYDETTGRWDLNVATADGEIEHLTADLVISAVGVLNRPKRPDLPGADTFAGQAFHTADWPADLDLTGKRVAIIGTGASSMQTVPAIAPKVGHLTIFQRSPQWVAPFEQFRLDIPAELRRLLGSSRVYAAWYWFRLFWNFGDKVIEALRVDPEWEFPERSVNARNDAHRRMFTRYIEHQLAGREDLIPKVMPGYPPFGKRILLDNGWYSALRRDNVSLVNEAVTSFTPEGPVDASGTVHPVDVVIWATGFDAARFVSSLTIRGIDGARLRDVWEDDNPKAYLGVSVPGFPNLFLLGGPNSFPGSGSFMYFMEVQMAYIRDLLEKMFAAKATAIDAKQEVSDRYNALVDATHARTVWTHPGMTTYYRNSKGRVVFVMPFLNLEYWEMTRDATLADYTVRTVGESAQSGTEPAAVSG